MGRFFYVCVMHSNYFLHKLSNEIIRNHKDEFHNLNIVLPNKRAKVYLEEHIKNNISTHCLSPEILSIEDFLFELTQIKSIDNIELLFEFYEVYKTHTPDNVAHSFDEFSNWAPTLLQDFNEIDRYLLNPNHVLSYLKDIEDIKHWSLDVENQTPLIKKYLSFYNRLTTYYVEFYNHLKNKKIGYQGLIYREAVNNIHKNKLDSSKKIIFAGFNALNQAEEKIFQHLLNHSKTKVYWDTDEAFYNDAYQEAGHFTRIYKNWNYYNNNPFEWMVNEFSESKNIQIIGTPKSVGQVKIVSSILEDFDADKINNTAVVLGDENLLSPLLHSLPNNIQKLNITMGYSALNNPVQIFFNKLFKLHINASKRKSYTFYYKDIIDVISNPIISSDINSNEINDFIISKNISFIGRDKFLEIISSNHQSEILDLIFSAWNNNALEILEKINAVLQFIHKNHRKQENLNLVFLFSIHKLFIKLENYLKSHNQEVGADLLFNLYKKIVSLSEVSFEGEPLGGLQIMGILETRTLDFENVFITSVNEGKLPAGKTPQSFIPFDVKIELGLPTYKEKDAIFAYHFYHLLLRAKNIYLLYNTESEGIDAGEKSRFITQLEIEKKPNHNISHNIYAPYVPSKAFTSLTVHKTILLQNKLKELAEKGFSPSSLTQYLRNPIDFYYKKIVGIREQDEVEETIALNTLGTIIHHVLEDLYKPYLNVYLNVEIIDEMQLQLVELLNKHFESVYSEGNIQTGKNYLSYQVAKKNIENLLKWEKNRIIEFKDTVKIIHLEQALSFTLNDSSLPYEVKIGGKVDRIEIRNNIVRIIDYKTGKVEPNSLLIKDWDNLLDIASEKIFQLLTYVLMFSANNPIHEIESGIISFKNMSKGFMPCGIKGDKDFTITREIQENFKGKLIELIREILDSEKPFEEVFQD